MIGDGNCRGCPNHKLICKKMRPTEMELQWVCNCPDRKNGCDQCQERQLTELMDGDD